MKSSLILILCCCFNPQPGRSTMDQPHINCVESDDAINAEWQRYVESDED